MTLQEMTDALRPCLPYGSQADLLARLPFEKRTAANFIEKFGDELEAMLGRRPVVEHASYTPSGRGAFGRAKGGHGATTRPLAVRWAARPTHLLQAPTWSKRF